MAEKRNVIINGYAYPNISSEVLAAWLPDITYGSISVMGSRQRAV